jgi:hypothetical protein
LSKPFWQTNCGRLAIHIPCSNIDPVKQVTHAHFPSDFFFFAFCHILMLPISIIYNCQTLKLHYFKFFSFKASQISGNQHCFGLVHYMSG